MRFDQAFHKVIGHEGGYVNDPKDPGGETKYGISKRSYPDEDIKNLTLDRAKAIYRADYWNKCRCDELPADARMSVFDAAVNSGVAQATKWLQRAVGTTADGKIGPKTLAAANALDGKVVAMRVNGLRLEAMTGMKNWKDHGKGWARRIAKNLVEA